MNPKEILKSWGKYFNNANLPCILNLYDTRSILIPTFSSEILSDKRVFCKRDQRTRSIRRNPI
jgi:hypothetical protein